MFTLKHAAFAACACAAGVALLRSKPALRLLNRESTESNGSKSDSTKAQAATEGRNGHSKKNSHSATSSDGKSKKNHSSVPETKEPDQRWFNDSGVLNAVLNVAQWPLDYIEKSVQGTDPAPEIVEPEEKHRKEVVAAPIEPLLPKQRLIDGLKNRIPSKSIYYKDIESEAAACLAKQKAAKKAMNNGEGSKNGDRGMWRDPDFGPEDSSLSSSLVSLLHSSKPVSDVPPQSTFVQGIFQMSAERQQCSSLPWKLPRDFSTSKKQPGHGVDGEGTWLYVDIGELLESSQQLTSSTKKLTAGAPFCNRYFATALVLAVQNNPLMCDSLIDFTFEAQGIYGVTFFVEGKWSMVWVDSYFPCLPAQSGALSERARALFPSVSDPREFWTMVVEKAYAKLHHSYEGMLQVPLNTVLEQITGGDANLVDLATLRSNTAGAVAAWRQIEKSAAGRGRGGLLSLGSSSSSITLVAAASRPPPDTASASNSNEEALSMQGIAYGTVYAVVAAVEAAGHRLVCLRGPAGASDWSGDWSPTSALWAGEAGAAVKAAIAALKAPAPQAGDVWLALRDFIDRFDAVATLRTQVSSAEHDLRSRLLECVQSSGAGPWALAPGLELRYRHLMQRAVADRMALELLSAEGSRRKTASKPTKAKVAKGGGGKAAAGKVKLPKKDKPMTTAPEGRQLVSIK